MLRQNMELVREEVVNEGTQKWKNENILTSNKFLNSYIMFRSRFNLKGVPPIAYKIKHILSFQCSIFSVTGG